MNRSIVQRLVGMQQWGCRVCALALVGLVGVGYAVTAPIFAWLFGSAAWVATFLAAAATLVGALAALFVSSISRGPSRAVTVLLGGILLRMGIPLMVALVVYFRRPDWVDAGFLFSLIIFYLLTLGVETAMILPASSPDPT